MFLFKFSLIFSVCSPKNGTDPKFKFSPLTIAPGDKSLISPSEVETFTKIL